MLQNPDKETVLFLPPSSKEFRVLIWLFSEGWNIEVTLKPSNGLEPGTPKLRAQSNYFGCKFKSNLFFAVNTTTLSRV